MACEACANVLRCIGYWNRQFLWLQADNEDLHGWAAICDKRTETDEDKDGAQIASNPAEMLQSLSLGNLQEVSQKLDAALELLFQHGRGKFSLS